MPIVLLAANGDTTVVRFQNKMDMNYYGNFDFKGKFPDGSKSYHQILMKYTLGCSSLGCSGWDYTNNIQYLKPLGVYDSSITKIDTTNGKHDTTWKKNERIEKFELGRVITPYGTYMKAGTNGYQPSWQHQYLFDVTDFASLLKDSGTIRCFYSGYSTGFAATVDFYFIEGAPPRNVLKLENLWGAGGNGYGYGVPDTFEKKVLPKLAVNVLANAKGASLQFTPSGHGFNNDINAAEFYDEKAKVMLNNAKVGDMRIWREDCGINPISPQGGTWIYNRANWCPGTKVNTFSYDMPSALLHPGSSDSVDVDFNPYTYSGSGGASYIISSVFFQYGDYNFTNDISLTDIITPSSNENYRHFNPICNGPIIEVKNNGKNTIYNFNIKYGLSTGVKSIYTWSDTLNFNQIKQITLPAINWTGAVNGSVFEAEILSVNNATDQWNFDNKKISSVIITPKQDADIIVWFKTNNRPEENSYKFLDWGNNVVFQRGGFTAKNFVYKDTIHLAVGCHSFVLRDEGGDGITWWADTAAGSGYLSFKRMSGTTAKNFVMDFGSEILYNFTTSYLLGVNENNSDDSNLLVYPNPSSGQIHIELNQIDGIALVSVIDITGKEVFNATVTNESNDINVANLSRGIYLVRANDNGVIYSKKVIIQ